jgi:GT2 family glycosyltransferase
MVSILVVTLNRESLTRKCLSDALAKADYPYELLSVDNGSTDGVADFINALSPAFHRRNTENEGYAPCLNQMLLRASGDMFCVLDPDLIMPQAWLRKLVEVNEAVPNSGVSGFVTVFDPYVSATVINQKEIFPQPEVFGPKFFNRVVLEKVGYYSDEFTPYGCEDADMNYRVSQSGFMNYYLGGGDRVLHAGDDCGDVTPYRAGKWEALKQTGLVLSRRREYQDRTKDFYEPAPKVRWI